MVMSHSSTRSCTLPICDRCAPVAATEPISFASASPRSSRTIIPAPRLRVNRRALLVRSQQISDQTNDNWHRQELIITGELTGGTSSEQAELLIGC